MRSKSKVVLAALVAVFAFSAVASSALAAPEWYAKKAGAWAKITTPLNAESSMHFELTDTKGGPLHEPLTLKCEGSTEGKIGAGGAGKITSWTVTSCSPKAACLVSATEAANLPWNTELYTEAGKIRDKIVSSIEGKQPVWIFDCNNGSFRDECDLNTNTGMSNNAVSGNVEAAFDEKSSKTLCSRGGKEAGVWKGVITVKHPEGTEAIKVE